MGKWEIDGGEVELKGEFNLAMFNSQRIHEVWTLAVISSLRMDFDTWRKSLHAAYSEMLKMMDMKDNELEYCDTLLQEINNAYLKYMQTTPMISADGSRIIYSQEREECYQTFFKVHKFFSRLMFKKRLGTKIEDSIEYAAVDF